MTTSTEISFLPSNARLKTAKTQPVKLEYRLVRIKVGASFLLVSLITELIIHGMFTSGFLSFHIHTVNLSYI